METKFTFKPSNPYGLHDMVVNRIQADKESIHLNFENGFVKLEAPYPQVKGSIEITGVDFDFVVVNLMSRFGKYGGYRGEKLELTEFFNKYPDFSFEIVDEMYSYHQVWYSGYVTVPDTMVMREMELSIYYDGGIIYRTEE